MEFKISNNVSISKEFMISVTKHFRSFQKLILTRKLSRKLSIGKIKWFGNSVEHFQISRA